MVAKITTEYIEFVSTAMRLAEQEIKRYPLDKDEVKKHKERIIFRRHLFAMVEMYDIRHGGISNAHTRLQTLKEIAKLLSDKKMRIPNLKKYLKENIADLKKDLGNL